MTRFLVALLLFVSASLSAAPIELMVSLLPQQQIAERIGGDQVSVHVFVGKGLNPETFEPAPSQLASLAKAELYLTSGMPFEQIWLPRFKTVNPGIQVLDMRQGLDLISDQAHGGQDPHVWTDPLLVKQHAVLLAQALTELRPEQSALFSANLSAFEADIDKLDAELSVLLAAKQGQGFLVLHPAWGYFARRYGLFQLALEHEGKEPGSRHLAELAAQVKTVGINSLYAQPQGSPRQAQTLADKLGLQLRFADPLAADLFAALRDFARQLSTDGNP